MTTQGNETSTTTNDETGTAPMPVAGEETAAAPAPSHAALVGDEDRESTMATDESQEMTGATGETQERDASQEQLVSRESAMDFKTRWEAIQQGFVDDPRSAVSDADSLVSDVLQQLSKGFDEQHSQLEAQWNDGEPDTEGLRSALQRYRDFFDRLLTI